MVATARSQMIRTKMGEMKPVMERLGTIVGVSGSPGKRSLTGRIVQVRHYL